mgnify:CR=1 FL=1
MKRNKWLPMVLAVVAIGVLGGGYMILDQMSREEDEVETVAVPTLSGEIDSIEYTSDTGKVSLVKNGDVWQWSEDAAFPLRQDYPQAMASQAQTIEATSLVRSDGQNLSDYGLDDPAQSILLSSQGDSITCLIGDLNSYTDEYYMMLEGEKEIYTVPSSFPTTFSYGLYDMIEMEQWPVSTVSSVNSVTVEKSDGSSWELTASQEDDEDLSYQVDGKEADDTSAQEYVRNITYLTVSQCVNYKASDSELTTYGLDSPEAILRIRYSDSAEDDSSVSENEVQEITLTIGASNGNDGYYVRIGDSQAVNVMSAEVLDEILSQNAADFEPAEETQSSSGEQANS